MITKEKNPQTWDELRRLVSDTMGVDDLISNELLTAVISITKAAYEVPQVKHRVRIAGALLAAYRGEEPDGPIAADIEGLDSGSNTVQ